jgi:hypothetical protein
MLIGNIFLMKWLIHVWSWIRVLIFGAFVKPSDHSVSIKTYLNTLPM